MRTKPAGTQIHSAVRLVQEDCSIDNVRPRPMHVLTTSKDEPRSWRSSPALSSADTAGAEAAAGIAGGTAPASETAASRAPGRSAAETALANSGGGARCSSCSAARPGSTCSDKHETAAQGCGSRMRRQGALYTSGGRALLHCNIASTFGIICKKPVQGDRKA